MRFIAPAPLIITQNDVAHFHSILAIFPAMQRLCYLELMTVESDFGGEPFAQLNELVFRSESAIRAACPSLGTSGLVVRIGASISD